MHYFVLVYYVKTQKTKCEKLQGASILSKGSVSLLEEIVLDIGVQKVDLTSPELQWGTTVVLYIRYLEYDPIC